LEGSDAIYARPYGGNGGSSNVGEMKRLNPTGVVCNV
jgi:hypothetical protein